MFESYNGNGIGAEKRAAERETQDRNETIYVRQHADPRNDQLCHFFSHKNLTCYKGDNCVYLHDPEVRRTSEDYVPKTTAAKANAAANGSNDGGF